MNFQVFNMLFLILKGVNSPFKAWDQFANSKQCFLYIPSSTDKQVNTTFAQAVHFLYSFYHNVLL